MGHVLGLLDLTGQGITNLSGLEHFRALEHLEAPRNQITDATAIAGLTGLRYLNLSENELASDLSGNPIVCAVEGAHIDALRSRGVQVIVDCTDAGTL